MTYIMLLEKVWIKKKQKNTSVQKPFGIEW